MIVSPATGCTPDAEQIVPTDTPNADLGARAVDVGGAGELTVVTAYRTVVRFVNVAEGTVLPVQIQSVRSTGTTASGLVALK